MKNIDTKLMISLALIVVFAGGIYLGIKYNSKDGEVPEVKEVEEAAVVPKLVDRSLVEEKTYNTPNKYTTFDIKYPQFKNSSADFNQNIENFIMEYVELHSKQSEENWKARYETQVLGQKIPEFPKAEDKYSLSVSWQPVQINNDFISTLLVIEGYNGGAHGYRNLATFNLDVKTRMDVLLADLFPNDPSYLKTVSAFVRSNLEAQFRKNLNIKTKTDEKNFQDSVIPMLNSGTEPNITNFGTFTFTSSGITFYFGQYQVAPYSMGESKVVLPRK